MSREIVGWMLGGAFYRVQQRDDAGFGELYPDQEPVYERRKTKRISAKPAPAADAEALLRWITDNEFDAYDSTRNCIGSVVDTAELRAFLRSRA